MTLDELEAMCKMVKRTQFNYPRDQEHAGLILDLIGIARAAQSLMSEDGAREAMAQYNCLHILADKLKEFK